jgi:hypothetical protein
MAIWAKGTTMRNWLGDAIEVCRSARGTLAVADPNDNLVRGGVTPWPPPEIVQKLYQSRQVRAFHGSDRERVTKKLGFYSDLQSLHSEDALTWSVYGPIAYASDTVKSRFVQSLLETIDVPVSSVGDVSVWLWRRLAHPDTLVPGGPEIDFGIRTEDLVVLGEAKWLSAVGGKQGKKRDKDQIVLRKEFIEKYGKAVFGDVSTFVILMVAPRIGMICKREERREGLTIFFREIPWEWLCSIDEHPCREELPGYLAWKRKNSVKYDEKLWGWKDGHVDPEGEHIQIRYREDPEPVALVANHGGEIVVRFSKGCSPDGKAAVRRELGHYFVELKELNPWGYAVHHCGTAANVYSKVRWGYCPGSL